MPHRSSGGGRRAFQRQYSTQGSPAGEDSTPSSSSHVPDSSGSETEYVPFIRQPDEPAARGGRRGGARARDARQSHLADLLSMRSNGFVRRGMRRVAYTVSTVLVLARSQSGRTPSQESTETQAGDGDQENEASPSEAEASPSQVDARQAEAGPTQDEAGASQAATSEPRAESTQPAPALTPDPCLKRSTRSHSLHSSVEPCAPHLTRHPALLSLWGDKNTTDGAASTNDSWTETWDWREPAAQDADLDKTEATRLWNLGSGQFDRGANETDVEGDDEDADRDDEDDKTLRDDDSDDDDEGGSGVHKPSEMATLGGLDGSTEKETLL